MGRCCIAQALSLNPEHRYSELSEFLIDLERPNPHLSLKSKPWIRTKSCVILASIELFIVYCQHDFTMAMVKALTPKTALYYFLSSKLYKVCQ
jgi:hypothetical protein